MSNKIYILIVDDEPTVLEFFSQVLGAAGYEVCLASTGNECLKVVHEKRPAIVLLDVGLPDFNGIEVCKRIKGDPDLRDVFVAICSGRATSTVEKVDGLQSGADDYITKPIEPAELVARIRILVKLRETIVALRLNQERYRSLAESSPDAIFILDREATIQYANSVAQQWLGRPDAELLGHSQADFFPADAARQHHESVQNVFATGEPVVMEKIKPFGKVVKWIETRFVPLRDHSGQVSSVMVIARDLTDAKRTRELLKEREKLSKKIIDSAMEGFLMLDLEGRLLDVNEAYCRMSGYSRDELLSMQIHDLQVTGNAAELVVQRVNRIVDSGHDRFETCHCRKDGKILELEVVATFLKSEKNYIFSFLRDITERKKTEKELLASEERFRQLAENIKEVFWITNPAKNEMIYVSPGYAEIWGRTCESLYAAPTNWIEAIHPDDRVNTLQAIRDKQLSGTYHEVYRIMRPDGSIRWIKDRAFPVRDESGSVHRIVGIAEDITQQIQAEDELRQTTARQVGILRSSLDAIITIDHSGRIIEFNATAEKMFGCSRTQAVGKEMVEVIICPELRTWFQHGLTNGFAASAGPVTGSRFEMPVLRSDGSRFFAEFAVVRIDLPGLPTFTNFVRDITGRKRAEQRLTAQHAVMRVLSESASLRESAARIVQSVCECFDWEVGAVWQVDMQTQRLRCAEVWGSPEMQDRGFLETLRLTTFSMGEGLPGLVWLRQKAVSMPDDAEEPFFPQSRATLDTGLKISFGFPVMSGNEVIAVLVFLSSQFQELDRAMIDMMYTLGGQIGQFVAHKKAEEALRAAEANYRGIFENAVEGIFQSTPEGRYLSANPALAQMLGYDSPEELISTVTDIGRQLYAGPKTRAELIKRLEAEGYVRDYENELYRKDGTKIWALTSVRVVRGEDGTTLYYEGVGTDITERKRAETQLAVLGRAVESTTELICITNLQDRFTFVNRAFLDTYGYTEAEVLGKTPEILLSQKHPPSLMAEILEQTRIHGWEGELIDRRKDGTEFPVYLSTSQIKDPMERVIGLLGVAKDITARKQAEERIRLLADAVQSTQNLICITDPENRLTFTNRAFLQAYGYQEDEVLGRMPDFLYSTTNPPSLCKHVFEQTLRGGWTGELLNRRKDGTEFPISLSTSIIKNNDGTTLGLIGVAKDISEQKHAENQINAFSLLSHRLNTATTPEQAGQIIFGIASDLFLWDSGYVFLHSPKNDRIIPILAIDTVEGRKIEVPLLESTQKPSAAMRLVMKSGAQLINGMGADSIPVKLETFGDTTHRSASRMFVPISSWNTIQGILSLQSYTANAYTHADLRLLQALTDHCGDALHRIQITSALQEAEAKYRGIVENATEGIFQTTPEGRYLSANPALARMFGYQSPDELISTVTNIEHQTYVSPLRRSELKQTLETKGFVRAFEAERRRKDGSRFWISINARVVRDATGKVLYYEGTNQDITERKEAKEELQQLPGRIIEAQEAERLRVARDLHDGVSQLMAAVKVRLRNVQHNIAASNPATGEILSRCNGLIVQAIEENRRLAHNLRPSDLDDFGLVIACRNLCKQFQAHTGIKVSCRTNGLGTRPPPTMELNLFRIVQEALNNIEKHARAKSVRIAFSVRGDLLVLQIRDDGRGFDPNATVGRRKKGHGMGLSNIRERAVLLGGTSLVYSAPNQGTVITIRIPFAVAQ